jgi:hypothetical protein
MNELEKKNSLILDRLQLKNNIELDLLNFIKLQIAKVNNENSLKATVLKKLADRLSDNEEPMNDIVLLKLLEILAKQDNEIALGIMDLMKNNKKEESGDIPISESDKQTESSFTKEDVAEVKDLLKTLEKVKKSEF